MPDGPDGGLLLHYCAHETDEGKSAAIAARQGRPGFLGNGSSGTPLSPAERETMIGEAAGKLQELFDALHVDHRNDHNMRDTPRRVARMLVEETMRGCFSEPPTITAFDNVSNFDQMLVTGPIALRSTCAHHLMPIYGEAFVGALPGEGGKVIGLSKYDRIVDHFASRLQIQEELVQQIGSFIMEQTKPRGLAVRINAVHMCKTHRGVRSSQSSRMVTTACFGAIKDDPRLRDEFLKECLGLERGC